MNFMGGELNVEIKGLIVLMDLYCCIIGQLC